MSGVLTKLRRAQDQLNSTGREDLHELAGELDEVINPVDELIEALREIHLQAADAQLRATYQRTALEVISAKAQAALAKAGTT